MFFITNQSLGFSVIFEAIASPFSLKTTTIFKEPTNHQDHFVTSNSSRRTIRLTNNPATFFALSLLIVLLSACGGAPPNGLTPTVTLTATPTLRPTLTPTPMPLGSVENPFIIGLVTENSDPQIIGAGNAISEQIWQNTGMLTLPRAYPSYTALLDAMAAREAHIAWMPPLTYLYASDRGLAEVALLTNHFGVYQYGAQFLANVESGFTPFFDPISGLSSADAATALGQFQGMRPCWVEPQSPSGYIVPAGLLEVNEIGTLPAVMSQTHTAVVRSLYIKGVCDFGATFAISGDPRTASAVQDDLPDVMNRVLILWVSDAVIPNINLSLISGLSERERQLLTDAFLNVASTPDGRAVLSISAGNYEIEDLRIIQNNVYDPLREVVKALDIPLREAVGK